MASAIVVFFQSGSRFANVWLSSTSVAFTGWPEVNLKKSLELAAIHLCQIARLTCIV